MHTSTVLRSSDFHYCRLVQEHKVLTDFHTLSQPGAASAPDAFPYVRQYRQVRGETFLAAMSSCFASPEAP